MPFKVTFKLYEPNKQAPCFTTTDRALAYTEINAMKRKQETVLSRMVRDVELVDPTKDEQYVYHVWLVRKAIKKFFNEGRKPEDKQQSEALEKELDIWNAQTRNYINAHPGFEKKLNSLPADSDKRRSFAFFLLVEKWRTEWHKFFAIKKPEGDMVQVKNEIKKACFAMEAEIDKYIFKAIGL